MSEVYAYAFVYRTVSKRYEDPYLAYQNHSSQTTLCRILSDQVVEILPERLISVKWAVACAQRVLNVFEKQYPDDKRPRQAILATKQWIKIVETRASFTTIQIAEQNVMNAANAATNATEDIYKEIQIYVANVVACAAEAAACAANTVTTKDAAATYAMCTANVATICVSNKEKEVMWQKKKLLEIINDPYFELAKINYHGNYCRLGLNKPFPFRDLGPKIMEY
jgi:hypothetical protein